MNNKFIMLLCATVLSISSFAQKISTDKVPASVISAFKTKFSTVSKVKWELESANEYEAVFKSNGIEQSASFDQNGKWIETETEIKVSQLPEVIRQAIATQFTGFKIEEVNKVDNAEKGLCYEAEIEKGKEEYEILLNSNGEVLSKKTEKEDKD